MADGHHPPLNYEASATTTHPHISTTITGEAQFLEQDSEEEKWCKDAHLANNTFGDQAREEAGLFGGQPPNAESLEGGSSSCYIEGDDVRVVVVRVKEGRIADWKGGVKDWKVVDEDEATHMQADERGRREEPPLLNGVIS